MPKSSKAAAKEAEVEDDVTTEEHVVVNKNVNFARSKRAWFAYILIFLFLRHFLNMVPLPLANTNGWTILHVAHCLVRSPAFARYVR